VGRADEFGQGFLLAMDAADRPWVVSADGLIVTVRLTPKAGRDSIDGIAYLSDGRMVLKARVSAAPSDGEANGALMRLLAQTLRIAPRNITLIGGTASRIKRMLIKGDVAAVVAALEEIGEVAAR
jgi:uncharacterized protein (TIGR00251 family)